MFREKFEEFEERFLHPKAQKSIKTRGRKKKEKPCRFRTEYQRDRDRILHSKAFRRLKHKTQVFLSPVGDHYRTRLTHTLEVAQIARTIGRALNLNEDLIEAIALGHDLGHTPFGHTGEAVLNELLKDHGGFRHPYQSLRVVDYIEKDGKGLNLTWEVREGIVKHSKGFGEILNADVPVTLEGQVVRISDIVAYLNHDLDDALRAKVLKIEDVPSELLDYFGRTHAHRITTIVSNIIETTLKLDYEKVAFDDEMDAMIKKMRDFLKDRVYLNRYVKSESDKAKNIIEFLYTYFMEHLDQIPFYGKIKEAKKDYKPWQVVRDYISGMTDRYAIEIFRELFIPKPWATF